MRITLKSVATMVVWAALLGWISLEAMSAIIGPAGYREVERRRADLAALEAEVAELSARRQRLTARADMLNDEHIDAELLDERIRAVLGYVAENEWVATREDVKRALASPPAR